ncbi:MAG: pyruvate, phosphate dikinase [Planctomycetota bacterium]|jgi:pyruvate,orthophosphate dikinase
MTTQVATATGLQSPSDESPASTTSPATKKIYRFGKGTAEGNATQRELLGGKGANLAEMSSIGLPVPPGFTITAQVCADYHDQGHKLPADLMGQVHESVAGIEAATGKRFGSAENPLLLSVRSGAAHSMPGMMDTVLNLGLNDQTCIALAAVGDPRFVYDAYRRLINMFGDVVMGLKHEYFETAFKRIKADYDAKLDTEVPVEGMKRLCDAYQKVYRKHAGDAFPQDPFDQLERAIEAVFRSWNTPRAVSYRQIHKITGLLGTGVNVQSMVFGNLGDDSGTGVAFTRNPSTGKNELYGEFLVNAQGEDVVAGIRTPRPVAELRRWNKGVHDRLLKIKDILERHYHDMQDIEFTIERGELFMLQTRRGERTGAAAVKIAVDLVGEGLIDKAEAVRRVPAEDLTQLLLPSFAPSDKKSTEVLAKGLPASPGAATGKLAFTAEEAVERAQEGEDVLLVRNATSPEDIDGMHQAVGIITSTGGMTSHAAVVARGWGKCCVAGAGDLEIDAKRRRVTVKGRTFTYKDLLSVDGSAGEILVGDVKRSAPKMSAEFNTIMEWADSMRRLGVRTNADTGPDSTRARKYGAEGIGLCRTEHMFFEGDRITAMREMILAETKPEREKALKKLLPHQRRDFVQLFTAMNGLPVTIRLLDPPLHEFVPHEAKAQRELAKQMDVTFRHIQQRVSTLHEENPMLGHRGCRLSISYPEILTMQVTAIVEATIACKRKRIDARPEIMIPLIATANELVQLRELTEQTIKEVCKAKKFSGNLEIPIGTMIEIPRAALTADEVARVADFFSFGTNDLTQMTYGFSRDDIASFLGRYLEEKVLEHDPFQSLDETGVGQLVETACRLGRQTNGTLKLGICGEHGGDPASIRFFHKVGLDYVSCSPFRVPIARLVAAQAALDED